MASMKVIVCLTWTVTYVFLSAYRTLTDSLADALVELNEDREETDCSDDFSDGDDDLE